MIFFIFAAVLQTLLNISQNLNLRDSFNHILKFIKSDEIVDLKNEVVALYYHIINVTLIFFKNN